MKTKRISITLFIFCIIIIIICLIFYFLTRSNGTYYNSVNSYIKENEMSYYDFYIPDSYLDEEISKRTLSNLNNIKVWYNVDPKDNYHVVFEKDNLEIVYIMNRTDVTKKDVKDFELMKNGIYYNEIPNFIESIYFLDNDKSLSVSIRSVDNQDIRDFKDIVIEILNDSINLNKKR